ncbi:MAG: type II toxin-antitoxin system RelE family toxin [Limnospira sp.]
MNLEVRYARSFLQDLTALEPAVYLQVYEFIFVKFPKLNRLQELPELRPLGASSIYYRFAIGDYLVGLEVTGHIVKFIRILPRPHV